MLYGDAARAAEELLVKVYGVDVLKALDPLKDKDFKVIVERLARRLANKTNPPERAVVDAAIRELDVDWRNLSRAQLDRVVDAANKVLGGLVPARLTGMPLINDEAPKIVGATRSSAKRKFKLDIPSITERDKVMAATVASMQGNFITDHTGEIVESLTVAMRQDVAAMLEAGLGSDEIAAALGARVTAQTLGKAENYWRTVSVAFANRARTQEQIFAYEDASIGAYIWESVMDARTTEICRFMDGKRFNVSNARDKFAAGEKAVQQSVRAFKDEQPWVTITRNEETGKREMVARTSAGDERIATIEEAGFGEPDRTGKYSNEAPLERLEALGVSTPPVHGLCRSTIVADV